MTIQGVSQTGILNESFPLWKFGGFLYWTPRIGGTGKIAQLGRGVMTEANDFQYDYVGSAGSSDLSSFNPDTGRFEEVAFAGAGPPLDGHFQPERSNTFSGNETGDRGPFTRPFLALALLTPAPSDWIFRTKAGLPSDVPLLHNFEVTTQRMYKLESSQDASSNMWSMCVRRSDGGQIDANTCSLGVSSNADPLGPDIASGTTRYDKIREDGWYRISRILPPQPGAPTVFYWMSVQPGITSLAYEGPQVEAFSTTIAEPTSLTGGGATVTRNKHIIELTGSYPVPNSGWMGGTLVPYTNAADLAASSPGVVFGEILTWRVDDNNRHRIIWSSSLETISYQVTQGGAAQASLEIPQSDVLQGVPLGVCATWGTRRGSPYMMLGVNGTFVDVIDIINTSPSGTGSIFIGSQADTQSSVANIMIEHAAFGNKQLNRNDVQQLSRWFQRKSRSVLGIKGS